MNETQPTLVEEVKSYTDRIEALAHKVEAQAVTLGSDAYQQLKTQIEGVVTTLESQLKGDEGQDASTAKSDVAADESAPAVPTAPEAPAEPATPADDAPSA